MSRLQGDGAGVGVALGAASGMVLGLVLAGGPGIALGLTLGAGVGVLADVVWPAVRIRAPRAERQR